jgi:hypothetical protein
MPLPNSIDAPQPPLPRRGVSLANLFMLITVCGVLVAFLMPVIKMQREKNQMKAVVVASVLGSAAGMLMGIPVGLCQRRPKLGVVLGIPLGMVVGAIVGPLTILPAERFGDLLRIAFVGGTVLVGFALISRKLGQ